MAAANFEAQLQHGSGLFTADELTYGNSSPRRAYPAAIPHAAGLPSPLLEQRRMSRDDNSTPASSAAANLAAPSLTPKPSHLQQSIMAGSLVDVATRNSPGLLTPRELQQLSGTGVHESSQQHSASCQSPSQHPLPSADQKQPKVIQQHVQLQQAQPSRIPSPSHSYWRSSRGGGAPPPRPDTHPPHSPKLDQTFGHRPGQMPSRLPGKITCQSFSIHRL